MFGLFKKKIPVVEHLDEVVHNSLYIKENFLRIWNSIDYFKDTISLEEGDKDFVLLFDIYNQYYSALYFSNRFPMFTSDERLNCELLSTLIYLDLSYNLHTSNETKWSFFRSFEYSRYKPQRKRALKKFQNLINKNKPFLYFGDELTVLIEFFTHNLKKQEFINVNPSEFEKYCNDLKKELERFHIESWKNDLMRPEDNFAWESLSMNRFKVLIKKFQSLGETERENIRSKNFSYDYMYAYPSMVIDIILNESTEHLNKKEQYVLGAIHFIYWIDCVGKGYGYDMSTGSLYGGSAAGLLANNLGVYSESDGLGVSFIVEVGDIILKKCHSSKKMNWLEEVKKRTKPTALPLYSADGLQKSNYKYVEDYARSLKVPNWTETNAFFLMLMDIEFLQSAKQGLSDIVKEAEAKLSAR